MLSKLQKSNLENRIIYSIHRSRIPDNIYPARGRKLCSLRRDESDPILSPDNIYPARGRKPPSDFIFADQVAIIPDNIYPARGRKRKSYAFGVRRFFGFPTIFTPQGDGNSKKVPVTIF